MPNLRLSILSAGLVLSLSACATYSSHPLSDHPTALDGPTAQDLAKAADRPFLSPAVIDLSKPLNANAIATIAVIANPDLKALRAREKVSEAQAFSAGLLPDPTFSLGADSVLSGPDPLPNLTAALGFDLNALRTHGVTLAQSKAQTRQARLDLAWSEWQTAGQARLQYVRILSLKKQLDLARASRDASDALLVHTERAASQGDVDGSALQTARQAALSADDAFSGMQRALTAATLTLNHLLGLPPQTILSLEPAPAPPTPLANASLFAIALDRRADLAALRAGYAAQEAGLHLAVLNQFPALNLTLNANRDSSGNFLLGPALDLTLPVWNRNRGGIAIETETRAALKAEYEARLVQARDDIAASVKDIELARQQRARWLATLPNIQRFADASRVAAARGDLAPATAEAAAQTLRDTRTQIAKADQDIAELSIGLELLTGTPQGQWTP